jgi:cation transport protein ChaC
MRRQQGWGTLTALSIRCAEAPRLIERLAATAIPAMTATPDNAPDDLWVFGYGSLMWRPGFDYLERTEGLLIGAHRALCIYSWVHRGTQERPGLVLGLDNGGACRGIVYRVAAAKRDETIAYLRAREQATMVYREEYRPVRLAGDVKRHVRAVCYTADRRHPQYAGRLSIERQLDLVLQGRGTGGPNRDYVLETVKAIEALGYRESGLHRLGRAARARRRFVTAYPWAASSRSPSAISRAVASSIDSRRRVENASLSSPGGIGSRISTRMVPG